jgi:hypothetical protein
MTHRLTTLVHGRKAAPSYLLSDDIVAYALAMLAVTVAIAFLLARCFALGHG